MHTYYFILILVWERAGKGYSIRLLIALLYLLIQSSVVVVGSSLLVLVICGYLLLPWVQVLLELLHQDCIVLLTPS